MIDTVISSQHILDSYNGASTDAFVFRLGEDGHHEREWFCKLRKILKVLVVVAIINTAYI